MNPIRPISLALVFALAIALSGTVCAQSGTISQSSFLAADSGSALDFPASAYVSSLSPELALSTYERGLKEQESELAGYTATSVIDASLPDSAQKAEFELKRRYVAPGVLEFTPLSSSGDKFVKSNVIVRLLQSEVEHVRKREQAQTAIDSSNYKFSYKGISQINGSVVHVFEVKPRSKRVGLFKGRIYVDSSTGRLLRAEGTIVKSPSFFIKRIDFVQDYSTVDGFTLLSHVHSEAQTRLVGKAVVDITHRNYQPEFTAAGDSRIEAVAAFDGSN
jgi:hypothetical protein